MAQRKGPRLRLLPGGADDEGETDLPFAASSDDDSLPSGAPAGAQSGEIASGIEGSVSGVMVGQNIVAGQFATGEMKRFSDDDPDGDDNAASPFAVDDSTRLNLGAIVDQLKAEGLEITADPESEEKANIQANAAKSFVNACKKHRAEEPGHMGAVILELFESALLDIQTTIALAQIALKRALSDAPKGADAYARYIANKKSQILRFKTDLQKEVQEILEEFQRYLPHPVKTDFAHFSLLIFEACFKNVDEDKVAKKQVIGATLKDVLGSAYSGLTDFCSSIKAELVITDPQNLTPEDLLISRALIPTPQDLFDRTIKNERLTVEEIESIAREIEAVPHYTVAEINETFKELNIRTTPMWGNESLRKTLLGSIREYVMAGMDGELNRQAAIGTTIAETIESLEEDERELHSVLGKYSDAPPVSLKRDGLSAEPTAATDDSDDEGDHNVALTPDEDANFELQFDIADGAPANSDTTAALPPVEFKDREVPVDAIVDALDQLGVTPNEQHSPLQAVPEAVESSQPLITIGSPQYQKHVQRILSGVEGVKTLLTRCPNTLTQIIYIAKGITKSMSVIDDQTATGEMEQEARDGLLGTVKLLLETAGVDTWVISFAMWAYATNQNQASITAAYENAIAEAAPETGPIQIGSKRYKKYSEGITSHLNNYFNNEQAPKQRVDFLVGLYLHILPVITELNAATDNGLVSTNAAASLRKQIRESLSSHSISLQNSMAIFEGISKNAPEDEMRVTFEAIAQAEHEKNILAIIKRAADVYKKSPDTEVDRCVTLMDELYELLAAIRARATERNTTEISEEYMKISTILENQGVETTHILPVIAYIIDNQGPLSKFRNFITDQIASRNSTND